MSQAFLALALALLLGGLRLFAASATADSDYGSHWDPNGAAGSDYGSVWDPNG